MPVVLRLCGLPMPVNSTGTCCSHPSKHCSIRRIWAPGLRIDEITNPSDAYTASIESACRVHPVRQSRTRTSGLWGVRVENFIQKLNLLDTVMIPSGTENYTDPLPSINVSWSFPEKTNLRIAASQTVARPEFRELAPLALRFLHRQQ